MINVKLATMTINELMHQVHATAREKGWYQTDRNTLEAHMLIVSEVAEATEEVRSNKPPVYVVREGSPIDDASQFRSGEKPEGEAVELVDAVIRIADYFGYRGWDLEKVLQLKMEYNKTRSFRHGGKKF